MKTIRMTMAQALVRFLDNQYIEFDGVKSKFVDGIFTIFGHGIVCGLGQAMDENPYGLKLYQGKNEQGMAHAAIAYAKQNNRRKIIACSSSIGPGAANMITAAATATVNNIPLLLLTGDSFATRQPDPVLQQIEQPGSLSITTNDAFRPVCKYWDRITRPEMLMSAMLNAMRVLTDPKETGAVCISLCQDVEGESFLYPESFFMERVHRIRRTPAVEEDLAEAVSIIKEGKKPLIICGGGVRYSEAGEIVEKIASSFGIPFGETQAGKSACKSSHPYNLGGIGVTGNLSANEIAKEADVIIAVGTRLSDFTTSSKWLFQKEGVKLITVNISEFHGNKMDAMPLIGDAKVVLSELYQRLSNIQYHSSYQDEIIHVKQLWKEEMDRLCGYQYDENFTPLIKAGHKETIEEFIALTKGTLTQTAAIGIIREVIPKDSIIVGASGSLPGCLQRMWTTDAIDSYHMEYGYSCMGYEIAGALGIKLAKPETEVYSMVGDGSFLMLHSEMVTALQENKKINILLFDNCGFGCINNLEMSSEIANLATEFRVRDESGGLNGRLMGIDYAMVAKGYGYETYTVTNEEELRTALEKAKISKTGVLIDIKVLPKTMTDGYGSWWHVGLAEVSKSHAVLKVKEESLKNKERARLY